MTPLFVYNRGVCAVRPDCELVERERILAIVKNTDTNRFLIVQYTSNDEISSL